MRILIDLQGAQTSGSRHRGIGRYSLALSLELARLATSSGHDVHLLLNAGLAQGLLEVRRAFRGVLPLERIHAWAPPTGYVGHLASPDYAKAACLLREASIAAIAPDVLLVTSLFEGWGDEAVISVRGRTDAPVTAVILYDLIPLIQHKAYLADANTARFYYGRIAELRRADLWLAISDAARTEGIDHLDLPPSAVVNISSASNADFRPRHYDAAELAALRGRYGLATRFVMYTGGIDVRKNVEGLIRAFALLPGTVRSTTSLAIVCAASPDQVRTLQEIGREAGLAPGELRITGFVPEADLLALYHACTLFVFPSLHEGFGLPALEAMSCGAAVIGSNLSSIPEVIGDAAALFDPEDPQAIADLMGKALTDPAFLSWLRARAPGQASLFSWRQTAERVLTALTGALALRPPAEPPRSPSIRGRRPRLALVSPITPQRSGVATYSAELAPELAQFYDVDFVTDAEIKQPTALTGIGNVHSPQHFAEIAERYDRIVYQFGNSHYHAYMPDLMAAFPGVVVVHDVNVSGMVSMQEVAHGRFNFWTSRLLAAHGYAAALKRLKARNNAEHGIVERAYPVNVDAVWSSTRIIVHSPSARDQLVTQYGPALAHRIDVIPLLRRPKPAGNRAAIRKSLGFSAGDFVVCTFGGVGRTKQHDVILDAWFQSKLSRNSGCHLVIVGEVGADQFGRRLRSVIAGSEGGERVRITGYVSDAVYNDFLAAGDLAVQLRQNSRGETSAAAMDCLVSGVPAILNRDAAMADLPDQVAFFIPGDAEAEVLAQAFERLHADPGLRNGLADSARRFMAETAAPLQVGRRYMETIEAAQFSPLAIRNGLLEELRGTLSQETLDHHAEALAEALSSSLPIPAVRKRLLVDVTDLDRDTPFPEMDVPDDLVRTLLVEDVLHSGAPADPARLVVEPFAVADGKINLARNYAYSLLDPALLLQPDETTRARSGDVCLAFFIAQGAEDGHRALWEAMRVWGVPVLVLCSDDMLDHTHRRRAAAHQLFDRVAAAADVVFVSSRAAAERLTEMLDEVSVRREDPLVILVVPDLLDATHLRELVLGTAAELANGTPVGRDAIQYTFPRNRLVLRTDNPAVHIAASTVRSFPARSAGQSGPMLWGPYLTLQPGSYELHTFLTTAAPGGAFVDVCQGADSEQVAMAHVPVHDDPDRPATSIRFILPTLAHRVEFRVNVTRQTTMAVFRHELLRLGSDETHRERIWQGRAGPARAHRASRSRTVV